MLCLNTMTQSNLARKEIIWFIIPHRRPTSKKVEIETWKQKLVLRPRGSPSYLLVPPGLLSLCSWGPKPKYNTAHSERVLPHPSSTKKWTTGLLLGFQLLLIYIELDSIRSLTEVTAAVLIFYICSICLCGEKLQTEFLKGGRGYFSTYLRLQSSCRRYYSSLTLRQFITVY